MTSTQMCPACGEAEALRGEANGDDIEITCLTCAHRWARGDLRCRSCGGAETVVIPQVLARTSRGNQLSIMGHRDTVLCPVCDAAVIARCRTARQWVPEDYVSAFSYDAHEAARVHEQAASPAPQVDPDPRPRRPAPVPRQAAQEPEESAVHVPTTPPPTVRQAVADFMAAEPRADALAMLSLATFLGSGTRIDTLAGPPFSASLRAWFEATWGGHDAERRAAVRRTVAGAFGHWVAQGWIADDPCEGLGS